MTRVFIVGGATIDLFGIPLQPLKQHDSNPGKLHISFGGVARNIAENLAKMEVPVSLITAIGDDVYGQELLNHCVLVGIDVTHVLILQQEHTSTYLAILDDQKDMHIALSDMAILSTIDIPYLSRAFAHISSDDILFIDTNYSPEITSWMLRNAPCDVFVDPISSSKAQKLTGLYPLIYTFKPNLQEASALSGIQVNNEGDLVRVGKFFIDHGIKQVYISLGKGGCFAYSKTESFLLRFNETLVQNATGAGDALMAGLIYQHIRHSSVKHSLNFAMAVACLTIAQEESVHPTLSIDKVNAFLQENKGHIRWLQES